LPPLNALRAFEAAARHESFSRAATELFVTHGAVSHQVRALEEELGQPLVKSLVEGEYYYPRDEMMSKSRKVVCFNNNDTV
jgi:DNA-binding transcriptional LysR family regulator